MSQTKELTGFEQEEFERLQSEIKRRWLSVEPKISELIALTREMKSKRLYLARFDTYEEYAQATFGRTGKALDSFVWREEKKLKAGTCKSPVEKYSKPSTENLEYVGTETDKEDKPMGARQCGDVEMHKPAPLPVAVAAVRPPVSAALYNEIHAIVNYCKKAESKEPGIIHFEGYRHLVQMLKQLENRVQIILPGMEAMFAADEKGKPRCTSAEAESYCSSIGLPADDGTWFFDKMQGCGWKNGGESVKDCFATIRAWKRAGYMASQKRAQSNSHGKPPEKHWSLKETEAELGRLNKDQADFERRSAALRRTK